MLNKKHESGHTCGDHWLHGGTAAGGIGCRWVCNQGVFSCSLKYALADMHLKHQREKEQQEQEKQTAPSPKKHTKEHTNVQRWEAEDTLNNFHYETDAYYMILKRRSLAVAQRIFQVHCGATKVKPMLTNIHAFLQAAETWHVLANL